MARCERRLRYQEARSIYKAEKERESDAKRSQLIFISLPNVALSSETPGRPTSTATTTNATPSDARAAKAVLSHTHTHTHIVRTTPTNELYERTSQEFAAPGVASLPTRRGARPLFIARRGSSNFISSVNCCGLQFHYSRTLKPDIVGLLINVTMEIKTALFF